MKLSIEKLDTGRPFGEVHGEPQPHGLTYEQGGWPYDAYHNLIEPLLTEAQQKILASKRANAPKQTKPEQTPDPDDEREPADATDEVNLTMFLKGEVNYKATEIQATLKKRFGVNKPRPMDAAIYLVEEKKLLPWSEVAPDLRPQKAA